MLLKDTYCPIFRMGNHKYLRIVIFTIVLTMLFICAASQLHAQQTTAKGTITGSAIEENGKPAEYATISLLKAADSAVVKGAITNEAGKYLFERVPEGGYIIAVVAMGFNKAASAPFTIANGTTITIPTLRLVPESRALNTVNITAAKPLIERKPDRMVMNVANTVLAAGNNALEILEKAPEVTIDRDDQISLQGKTGVTVMINDKLTYLSETQLAALLRATDGTTIQSIEVITNPSSKYDAAGNSGIINIKLKKNSQSGTNGSITAGAGYGWNFRDNSSINLNHKQGDWNIFGSFSHGDIKREQEMELKRVVTTSKDQTFFDQDVLFGTKVHYNNYRFGVDYNTSKKNVIGFIINGNHTNGYDDNDNITYIGSSFEKADTIQKTPSKLNQTYRNIALNLNDKFQIDTLGQEISIDLDYSKFRNNSRAVYDTRFFLADGTEYKTPLKVFNETPSVITINTQKADYVKPFNKTLKFEAGIKFSAVKTDNDLQAKIDETGGGLIVDTTRTNRFIYDEKIKAAYVNLSKEFKTTSVQLGLRAEHTSSVGNLVTKNNIVKRDYLNLFPTLFINHKLGKKHEVGFSYSRRIDRPSYEDLNPFIYYLDQYTFSEGNPFLKPQYTNSFELNYTYNKNIHVSFNYSKTSDVFTEIILTDTIKKATYQTYLNFKEQNNYSLNLNAPYTVAKWWTGSVNFTGFYNEFRTNDLLGSDLNKGKAAFVLKTTQSFLLPKEIKGEIMTFYQSAMTYGIYNIKPQYSIDLGVSRSFVNKKLNIKVAVSDVFFMRRNDITAQYQTVDLDIRQRRETRIARINLTYNFGNNKIKSRERRTGADAESDRVKSKN
ncbi:TonB-dependent receptor [Mucilaginibacter hurinus]|uniref:TonB-dependent receptor n=1 Tax=Mucilaginibacter hurinus TaxID=2201324 RepID=A0A367GQI0_9SPHI|nr:outer membrane beta-barrel family protein [Mucilaginibacter hurinus]RCH55724.1 TonB-dependent receptor [Mucilaginibacter hurinus]